MTTPRRTRIAAAFSAAQEYDRTAQVQAHVAGRLAGRVAALPLPARPRLLEIGCGTGFLTAAMMAAGVPGDWLVTDLSAAMVARCRDRLGQRPHTRFAVLDGELGARPAAGPFDLIVSNLTFQWFDDLPAALARLLGWLAPGGHLLFTTLASGTFAEWRAAHAAEGLTAGTPLFPAAEELARLRPLGQAAELIVEHDTEDHADARAFLRALKAIGAQTAAPRHQPLTPAELRRVMTRFEAGGATARYEVVTLRFDAGAGAGAGA